MSDSIPNRVLAALQDKVSARQATAESYETNHTKPGNNLNMAYSCHVSNVKICKRSARLELGYCRCQASNIRERKK